MNICFKLNENLFYRIETGKCECIDVNKKTYKQLKTLPSGYIENVKVISHKEFNNAKTIIGL